MVPQREQIEGVHVPWIKSTNQVYSIDFAALD
jgi:hypothetical protein